MGFSVLDLFLLVTLLVAPVTVFFCIHKQQRKNPKLQKFAKDLGLANLLLRSSAKARDNFILLPIDKVLIDTHVIELCTEIYIPPVNQKTYAMYSNQHYKFWTSYLDRRWDMAIVIASSLRTAWQGQLNQYYNTMITRCVAFKQRPPNHNWNGTILKD
jgi:hypothetical protein